MDRSICACDPSKRRCHRLRWGIGVLLGVGVLLNYFDRVNLSVAGPALSLASPPEDRETGDKNAPSPSRSPSAPAVRISAANTRV